jgi:hypothetical protein
MTLCDSGEETRVPRSVELTQMPRYSGRVLRMAAGWESETALLLGSRRRRTVRVRGTMGPRTKTERAVDQVLFDPGNDAERSDLLCA